MKEGNELTWPQVVMAANAPVMTKAALVEGRTDVGVLPTGQVVGVLDSLPTVADIIDGIMTEADAVLPRLERERLSADAVRRSGPRCPGPPGAAGSTPAGGSPRRGGRCSGCSAPRRAAPRPATGAGSRWPRTGGAGWCSPAARCPGSSSSPRMAFHSRPFSRARRTSAMRLDSRRSLSAFSRSTDSSSSSALSTSSDPVPLRSSFWSGIELSAPLRRSSSGAAQSHQWPTCMSSNHRSFRAEPRIRRLTRPASLSSLRPRLTSPAQYPESRWHHTRCGPCRHELRSLPGCSATEEDRGPVTEQALVGRDGHPWPPRPGARRPSPGAARRTRTPGRWPGPGSPRRSRRAHPRG